MSPTLLGILIDTLVESNLVDEAENTLREYSRQTKVTPLGRSFSSIVQAYCNHDNEEGARRVFEWMRKVGSAHVRAFAGYSTYLMKRRKFKGERAGRLLLLQLGHRPPQQGEGKERTKHTRT